MEGSKYFKVGRASDLDKLGDRIIYRLFEIMPGVISVGVLISVIFLSWLRPLWVAIFIILFSIFWFFKTIYFSFHLLSGYRKMKISEKEDWLKKLKEVSTKDWEDIYHLIVIPMYNEPLEIVQGVFSSIVKSDYPKDKMIVVLACEEKTKQEILNTVQEITTKYSSKFLKFFVTYHPADLPGEIAGKGSNETWAVKKIKPYVDSLNIPIENILFSSFDVDTCVFPKYFSCLTYHYLTSEKPTKTSFQPIPLYVNNVWQAPVISRIFSFSSSFWHTMNQERPEKLITFSSHSMSYKALVDVGYKQTNVVADDSRIFWQCFLANDGDYHVTPLYYPISMDANVAKTFSRTMINIYKQQRRWAWGVVDIPFFLFNFLKNKKIPFLKKLTLGYELIEGHFSWATTSIMILVLGWLPLIIGRHGFSHTIMSYNLPKVISQIMTIAMMGLVSSIYLSFVLLPPKPLKYGRHKVLIFIAGWLLFPINILFFGSLPALEAQIRLTLGKYMGFWVTEKVRK